MFAIARNQEVSSLILKELALVQNRVRAREWQQNNKERYNARCRKAYAEQFAKKDGGIYWGEVRKAERKAAKRVPRVYKTAEEKWETWRAYRTRSAYMFAARQRARQATQIQAMPTWVDKEELKAFYLKAQQMAELTGIKHDVDHIIPLKHKLVCGLHIPANLQVLTASENRKKHNKFEI